MDFTFCYDYISSTSDRRALDPRGWGPLSPREQTFLSPRSRGWLSESRAASMARLQRGLFPAGSLYPYAEQEKRPQSFLLLLLHWAFVAGAGCSLVWWAGFSLRWPLTLQNTGWRAHRLRNYRTWALGVSSVVVVPRLSALWHPGISLDQACELAPHYKVSPALQVDS